MKSLTSENDIYFYNKDLDIFDKASKIKRDKDGNLHYRSKNIKTPIKLKDTKFLKLMEIVIED